MPQSCAFQRDALSKYFLGSFSIRHCSKPSFMIAVAGIVLFVVVGVPLLGFASGIFIVAAGGVCPTATGATRVVLLVAACGGLHVAANAGSTKMTAATR